MNLSNDRHAGFLNTLIVSCDALLINTIIPLIVNLRFDDESSELNFLIEIAKTASCVTKSIDM